MHLLNTLVAVIISVVISNALTIDVGAAIKEFKDSKEAITHEPIAVQPAGVVKGAKDCGSEATAVEMQLAGCEDLQCSFQAGTIIDLQIGFKAAEDFDTLNISITRIQNSQEDVLVEETWLTFGESGQQWMIIYSFNLSDTGSYTLKFQLQGQVVEVCQTVPVQVSGSSPLVVQGAELVHPAVSQVLGSGGGPSTVRNALSADDPVKSLAGCSPVLDSGDA